MLAAWNADVAALMPTATIAADSPRAVMTAGSAQARAGIATEGPIAVTIADTAAAAGDGSAVSHGDNVIAAAWVGGGGAIRNVSSVEEIAAAAASSAAAPGDTAAAWLTATRHSVSGIEEIAASPAAAP